ncbi:hypothetical protein [Pseudomonas veronii]|uniref:hypothetical protein n=1 Tax=Pseudomonas veronii TaxID=76761 RepID=UPI0021BF496F|nr:hypothetical protein [Pseudomonas veronii]MCT9827829.1 hypothetical protein [Pseudomonas veronii]
MYFSPLSDFGVIPPDYGVSFSCGNRLFAKPLKYKDISIFSGSLLAATSGAMSGPDLGVKKFTMLILPSCPKWSIRPVSRVSKAPPAPISRACGVFRVFFVKTFWASFWPVIAFFTPW